MWMDIYTIDLVNQKPFFYVHFGIASSDEPLCTYVPPPCTNDTYPTFPHHFLNSFSSISDCSVLGVHFVTIISINLGISIALTKSRLTIKVRLVHSYASREIVTALTGVKKVIPPLRRKDRKSFLHVLLSVLQKNLIYCAILYHIYSIHYKGGKETTRAHTVTHTHTISVLHVGHHWKPGRPRHSHHH